MISRPLRLGFLASGGGSSARAIVGAIRSGELAAEARLLVSNNRSAEALSFAHEAGVPSLCIPTQADPAAADAALVEAMVKHGVELIVLSGYLRRLGPLTLARYLAGRLTLAEALRRLGALCGAQVAAVPSRFGLAAVDVDKPADVDLVRELTAAPQ